MQPRELIIEGLTAFRERVALRFDDVSLFALVGPTGAGKSSVIDAMTLALYGRIPRLHANEIAPAISTNANECTVGLTFTVRGRPYRAVRTVRRTKTGASTLEAALEQLNDDGAVVAVLAGTADDVTVEVERLVGLTFNEFTRAVVLPQGEFARVLRAQPAERQALLSRLLGVGIYDRVKQRAGSHARSAQERAEQTSHQLAQLGQVDAERVAALTAQVQALDTLVADLAADTETLQDIRDRFRDAAEVAKRATDRVARLTAIGEPPEAVREHGERLSIADLAVEKATAAVTAAEADLAKAESDLPSASETEQLSTVVALHQRTPERTAAVESATSTLTEARAELARVDTALGRARTEVEAASAAQRAAHRDHVAVQAVDGLAPGDDCPVCASTLADDAPAFAGDAAAGQDVLQAAATRMTEANRAVGTLEGQHTRATKDIAAAETALKAAEDQLTAHRAQLDGKPTEAEARERIEAARKVEQQLAGLRREVAQARTDLERATRDRTKLTDQGKGLSGTLDRLRLSVAELDPPALDGDVVADWTALHEWAVAELPTRRDEAAEAERAVGAAKVEGSALRARMEQACRDAGIPDGTGDPRDRAVQRRADLAAERDRLTTMLELADNLRADEADAREQATVGGELARLLRTDQFQRWLLDEATRALVAGASTQLRALSSGRYELVLDGKNGSIAVADLASAGSPRSVRTLSGGETFLASLALALSLAEQIAVSASGQVALESLFIDEGFGALDPETLDIAAGAIEQLGAGDRTVGVVTHVAEMAERLPTRFVVHRTASGSRVERVDL